MSGSSQVAEHWSNYWERGALTTFAGAFANNYDDDIKDFWFEVFRESSRPLDAVVDLATGNGAVAYLLAEAALGANSDPSNLPDIVGVDYAAVGEPTEGVDPKLKGLIRFVGNTPIETLPFDDGSIDLVVSQFGFEYADQGRAVREVARVLRPGGSGAFIVHHTNSRVVKKAQESAELYRRLLVKKGFFPRLAKMIDRLIESRHDPVNRALASDPEAQRDREEMNRHLAEIYRYARQRNEESSVFGIVQQGLDLFADKSKSDTELRAEVRRLRADVKSFRQRMHDMRSAAHTRESVKKLIRSMEAAGIDVLDRGELKYQDRPFGWTLRFQRQ